MSLTRKLQLLVSNCWGLFQQLDWIMPCCALTRLERVFRWNQQEVKRKKAILTSKHGADGTLRAQFMLFCVISCIMGLGTLTYDADLFWYESHACLPSPRYSLHLFKIMRNRLLATFLAPTGARECFHYLNPLKEYLASPWLSVVPGTISDYLKAVSRASVPCPENWS